MMLLSIVVPCYNEAAALPHLYEALKLVGDELRSRVNLELILVNDGSRDETLQLMRQLHQDDPRVQYCSFSRNFGKESAMLAGLEKSSGDYVVIMDADLQDPPDLLKEMLDIIETGQYDCVASRRVNRKGEPVIRSFFARRFYKIINHISDTEIVDGARDFRMMTRQMVNSILSLPERNRFSKGLFSWVGYETKWLDYENVNRVAGETKWSFWQLLLYSFDGIIAFSTAPLAFASVLGLLISLIAIIFIFVIVIRTWIWGDPVSGWPSTISIILFIGGIQLLCIGILGQYLAKVYIETKHRPLYIIREESSDQGTED
ncbi:MAG: glycosyltransferase family 2 protein [Clostridiaceae bacterium]|nr:glycosyltransferase family 2 protein [Clostridiaceae bacterium]